MNTLTQSDSSIKIKEIGECDFPIEIREVNGYSVLVLPNELQKYFDEDGFHAVRIRGTAVAHALPAFGGKTVSSHSLLPHQDHVPNDVKRFLCLSNEEDTSRGSSTYIALPETVENFLPSLVKFFKENRDLLKTVFKYEKSFQASESDLNECFAEQDGIDTVVKRNIGGSADAATALFAYTGILTYLIQGTFADQQVQKFIEENANVVSIETWSTGGVFILDNSRVFHGRIGGNEVPLKRNWLISA